MSQKRVQFSEEEFLNEPGGAGGPGAGPSLASTQTRFKEKHSLDSDEEDDVGDKYDIMKEDDIEGMDV